MPQIITNDDGTQIEVFTLEELQQQREAAVQEYVDANPDKNDELEKLQTELKNKEEKLSKLESQDRNFAFARKQVKDAQDKIDELTGNIDTKINQAKKEIMENVLKDHYNETINSLVGNDEDLKKKVEEQYGRLSDPATTKAEIDAKAKDAYLLATKQESGVSMATFSSGGIGATNFKSPQKPFEAEEVDMINKLANAGGLKIDEKDFNQSIKWGPK